MHRPSSASAGATATVAFNGSGFYALMRVVLETQVSELADAMVISPTSATATFDPACVAPGTYAVTLRNAGGGSNTIVSAFTVTN